MASAVSRHALLATPVSRILTASKIFMMMFLLNDDFNDNFDDDLNDNSNDVFNYVFHDVDQVTGLATIKQGAAPAPQVENQLNNDDKNNDTYDDNDN